MYSVTARLIGYNKTEAETRFSLDNGVFILKTNYMQGGKRPSKQKHRNPAVTCVGEGGEAGGSAGDLRKGQPRCAACTRRRCGVSH